MPMMTMSEAVSCCRKRARASARCRSKLVSAPPARNSASSANDASAIRGQPMRRPRCVTSAYRAVRAVHRGGHRGHRSWWSPDQCSCPWSQRRHQCCRRRGLHRDPTVEASHTDIDTSGSCADVDAGAGTDIERRNVAATSTVAAGLLVSSRRADAGIDWPGGRSQVHRSCTTTGIESCTGGDAGIQRARIDTDTGACIDRTGVEIDSGVDTDVSSRGARRDPLPRKRRRRYCRCRDQLQRRRRCSQ